MLVHLSYFCCQRMSSTVLVILSRLLWISEVVDFLSALHLAQLKSRLCSMVCKNLIACSFFSISSFVAGSVVNSEVCCPPFVCYCFLEQLEGSLIDCWWLHFLQRHPPCHLLVLRFGWMFLSKCCCWNTRPHAASPLHHISPLAPPPPLTVHTICYGGAITLFLHWRLERDWVKWK